METSMKKDVLVSVKSRQADRFSEDTEIETLTPGEYYVRNGSHYVLYEETDDDAMGTTKNMLKFKEDHLELVKKGMVNVHMIFEEKKKNMANYTTPFGNLLIGIEADQIRIKEEEERIAIQVDYALEMNYEHQADCQIRIEISQTGTV